MKPPSEIREQTREQTKDASLLFAEYIEGLEYADLPSEVVDLTKKGILDTLGVIIAASSTVPEIHKLVELHRKIGGEPEATVLGHGDRLPAWHAGYLNGAMGHALDYDDLHAGGLGHLFGPILPAALAMSERRGRVTGRELITAVVAGIDLHTRLTSCVRATGHQHEWHVMAVNGVFGATAACGKLGRLDARLLGNAFGIAFTQAAGTMQMVYGLGSNMRGMVYAVPGEVGVRSVLMAEAGLAGIQESFESDAGLLNVYYQGNYDRSVLVDDLGRRFLSQDDGFKPWPACGFSHIYIDMVLGLMRDHEIAPEQVEAVTLSVGDFAQRLCEPLDEKRRPSTSMIAKFSLPFTVATAMAHEGVVIGDFLPENLANQAILDLADRVHYRLDQAFDFDPNIRMPAGKIEIVTRDGRSYSREQDVAYGHPTKKMSWQDLAAKFEDCASYSATPLSRERIEQALDRLAQLEKIEDVNEIVDLLTPSSTA